MSVGDFADSLLGTSAREGDGTPDASYVRDPNGTLTVVREGSQRRYVIADMLGSVIALTDESGAVTQEYTYTPYGQTSEAAHAGVVSNPWRYTGAYHDQAQSLYKMGIRYLQPSIGKFTQPDPALSQARLHGANPYTYANCNPTNNTDPTGACGFPTLVSAYTGGLIGAAELAYALVYATSIAYPAAILLITTGGLAVVGAGLVIGYCALYG